MKRWLVFGLLIVLCWFTVSVFADDAENYQYKQDDTGTEINTTINDQNVNLTYIQNRKPGSYTPDTNGSSQLTELTLKAEAFIPCYLRMVVTTNLGKTSLESFGPGAEAKKNEEQYELIFDNEIGGFVTQDWTVVGHGRNAQIPPGPNYFIRGCDLVKVELYSNDKYQYEVISSPLSNVEHSDQKLDLQMRTQVDSESWGTTWSFGTNGSKCTIKEKEACQTTLVYHDFRVPYLGTIAHGEYSGVVTFKAYTL